MKFRYHKVYIKPKGSDKSLDHVIGIHSRNLYRIHFDSVKDLVSNNNNNQGDMWHSRMAHLHHAALKHLRQIIIRVPHLQEENNNH